MWVESGVFHSPSKKKIFIKGFRVYSFNEWNIKNIVPWCGEHTIQYTDGVLWNGTPKTYIIKPMSPQ